MAKTLEEFRATKTVVDKDAAWCEQWAIGQTSQKVAEYDGGCFIYLEDDGEHLLVIANAHWSSHDLGELEAILYREWYLPEIAGVPREDD